MVLDCWQLFLNEETDDGKFKLPAEMLQDRTRKLVVQLFEDAE